ncbi:MAG: hypothetical protein IJ610_10445 [Bacteroidaceae bacterium]|nr:hypothetical protein [Bacteroidaceae bacterium]
MGTSGGRKEEGRTSGETAGRRSKRREEGRRRKNQRGNRWTWGRAEKGAHEQGASPGEGLPNGCV